MALAVADGCDNSISRLQTCWEFFCPFFLGQCRARLTANSKKDQRCLTSKSRRPTPGNNARSESKSDQIRSDQIKPHQAEREAVGERAVEPASHAIGDWLPIREPRAQRSEGPSERSALPRIEATFFGDFLFCQKRKLPPPGRRSTPKNPREARKREPSPAHRIARQAVTQIQEIAGLPPLFRLSGCNTSPSV